MDNVWEIMGGFWLVLILALTIVLLCNPQRKWPPRDTTLLKVRSQIIRTIDHLEH